MQAKELLTPLLTDHYQTVFPSSIILLLFHFDHEARLILHEEFIMHLHLCHPAWPLLFLTSVQPFALVFFSSFSPKELFAHLGEQGNKQVSSQPHHRKSAQDRFMDKGSHKTKDSNGPMQWSLSWLWQGSCSGSLSDLTATSAKPLVPKEIAVLQRGTREVTKPGS